MKISYFYKKCLAIVAILTLSVSSIVVQGGPVKIIFDTDMASDVDDVGALAVLHALADEGEAEILGCMISAPHEAVAPCMDAINTYYGRPDIPIGNLEEHPKTYPAGLGEIWTDDYYGIQVVKTFPHSVARSSDAPGATKLYRKILASQPDQSVTIVTVGFLTNLKNLLNSLPDEYSSLNGEELVKKKVKQWVCGGCHFPRGTAEYNVKMDVEGSVRAINDWPTPVIFSGWLLGTKVMSGNALLAKPKSNPVRMSYEWFWGRSENVDRCSWDQLVVLYAVKGCNNWWILSESGRCLMYGRAVGENEWIPYAKGSHHYLKEKIAPGEFGKIIDELMCRDPKNLHSVKSEK